ncbi:histidine kinase dimerization/phospho-acceptor domain-containing protein, partial [Pararhodobacter sp.]|uniref:histidine kinase dimerization/phospho-acceptor domain-containing protein n=1 Tax=Pararhodobacter sp. TaxID=2127056 RepID=UPI002FDF4A31
MRPGWRPSLAFVLGGGLAGTLALSFAGLVALRYLGPAIGFRNAEMILAALIALGTAFLGWLQWRLLLRPTLALEAYAEAQESAATPERPRHFGTRETYRTGQRVIAMAEALRDREATIRAHTDHVTHELKTPVSAIRAAVELLEDGGGLGEDDRALVAQIDGARAQIEAQLAALRRAAQAREVRYLGVSRLGEVVPGLAADFPELRVEVTVDAEVPLAPEGLRIVLG